MSVIHYASPGVIVGKHDKYEWRVIVVDTAEHLKRYGDRSTRWQWRPVDGDGVWNDYRQWPGYDFNNGMTLGLPFSMLKRLRALYGSYTEQALRAEPVKELF